MIISITFKYIIPCSELLLNFIFKPEPLAQFPVLELECLDVQLLDVVDGAELQRLKHHLLGGGLCPPGIGLRLPL